jgi:phosphatidylserine decarboxylase
MKIHKAGFLVLLIAIIVMSMVIISLYLLGLKMMFIYIISGALFVLLMFIVRFFRSPKRDINFTDNQIVAPADGTVVVIEEVEEKEFLNKKSIQVSIFMSIWNVHINWLPVLGKVLHTRHCSGRYMAAWLPKSSEENERALTIIETKKFGKILVKQIAGALARRIVTYAKAGDEIKVGEQLGFIRFGSRVDLLIPVDSNIKVKLGDKVVGGETLLADI